MNDQMKAVLRAVVTDLVKNDLIVKKAGDTVTLFKPIWGYTGEIDFKGEQDAIERLYAAAMNHYAPLLTVRAAS